MFTERGLERLAELLAAEVEGGQIVVTDGADQQDGTSITSVTRDGTRVTVSGVFGEDKGNFDWRERWIVVDQKVIDLVRGDFGRKSPDSVWTAEVTIDVAASAGQ